MKRVVTILAIVLVGGGLMAAGCSQATPAPTPTKPAAAPTKAAESTKPAAAATKPAEPTKPAATAAPAAVAKKVDFPAKGKTITLLVGFAAGGAGDIGARLLATPLEKELGVPIQVENKAGASSQVAYTDLVRSKPDGYTLVQTHMPGLTLSYLDPSLKAIYTRKDFQPIANDVWDPVAIAVGADSPYKDLKGLLDVIKADPEKVKFATTGPTSPGHLRTKAFLRSIGMDPRFVDFDGNAPAIAAVMGGHVGAAVMSSASFQPLFKSGDLRVLGIADKVESKFFPGVKTCVAQGYNLVSATARGWAAPAGTPKEIVDVLGMAMKKAKETDPEIKKKMDEAALVLRHMDAAEFEAYWTEEEANMRQLLKDLGK